jgi:hypothetical protein
MFQDALLLISDAQAVSATAVSTSSIDTMDTTVQRAIGTGEPVGFAVSIDVSAVITTTDETYQFDIVEDDDEALGSPNVIASFLYTAAMAVALQLVAGKKIFLPIPPGFPKLRYIGLKYALGGNADNAITVTASLMPASMFSLEPQNYPKNYVV